LDESIISRHREAWVLNYNDLRDEQLITLIAHGEKDALEVFYNRYARSVFSLARYMLRDQTLAEEATQDIFLNLWLKASSYNPQRGTPRAWFMSVAHHRIIDVIKARNRRTKSTNQVPHELLDIHPSAEASTEDIVQQNLDREQILAALSDLPEGQREVVILAYFEGYSQSEIASKLDQPLGTVKTRVRLAMQKLRVALKGHLDGE
jgi:RNA polymerase sigma-70 factor (ECF subfamily)